MKFCGFVCFLGCVLLFGLCGCKISKKPNPGIFKVGIRSLPSKMDPRHNEVNVYHYINLHLYFPLFERDENGYLKSAFLDMQKTKAADESFSKYEFCLKEGIRFSDGQLITPEDLRSSLIETHKVVLELQEIKKSAIHRACVSAQLAAKDAAYFDKLTGVQSTVLKQETEKSTVPLGLGPYQIQEVRSDRLMLLATSQKTAPFYQEIQFVKIETASQGLSEGLQDWNHIWQHLGKDAPVPPEVRRQFTKMTRPLFRTLLFVLKLKEERLRTKWIACLDRKKYNETLGLRLIDIPGYLPMGLAGSKVKLHSPQEGANQKDRSCSHKWDQKEIPFYHFYPALQEGVETFFKDQQKDFPLKVKPVLVSVEEAIRRLFGQEEMVIPIMADSTQASAAGFFTFLMGQNKIIPKEIPGLERIVKQASLASDEESKELLFGRAHKMVLDSGYILPLGQVEADFYYPAEIGEIRSFDPINGFLLIHKLRSDL